VPKQSSWVRRSFFFHNRVRLKVRFLYETPIVATFLAGFGAGALLAFVFLALDIARLLATAG